MTLLPISQALPQLPDAPGIYLYYNQEKELVYVGKATSLQSRVRSYWRGLRTPRPIETMIHEVVGIDIRVTESVLEAIILEANVIKKFLPKYNVDGKDDKTWNYIVITKELFPQVKTMRQREFQAKKQENKKTKKQFAYVFGPYPGLNTRATMKLLRKLFRFSTCQTAVKQKSPDVWSGSRFRHRDKKTIKQSRPCLYYELGLCLGVCTDTITSKEYRQKVIRPLVAFLSGQKKRLVKTLEKEMSQAAEGEDFEEAGRLRDQIASLKRIQDIALLNRSFVEDEHQPADIDGQFLIRRIEGYDISNLGATGKVGSMVVFGRGIADTSQYRKFKIRTVEGQSDVDCLEEVIRRRLHHLEWPYPDLFLIDGGRPQVNRVRQILDSEKIEIPIIGIAKGPERKRNDIIFAVQSLPHKRSLIRWADVHRTLLIRVRDEAHRFAITYQRKLRMLPRKR